MFEARQGCAARECAAQGLIKLASTGEYPIGAQGSVVSPAGNTQQTAAVFVTAFVEEARRRLAGAAAPTAVQAAVAAVIERELVATRTELDAGLASWEEGKQMYQLAAS
eukprot:COSAG01_NODE_12137_length_1795_cov_1.484670_4_plen_109_part_00